MAITLGTNSGFVTSAPTTDPGGIRGTQSAIANVTADTSPATAARITQVGWYCSSSANSNNFEIGLYAESGSGPGALLYSDLTNVTGDNQWNNVSVDWSISANTKYWIGVAMDYPGIVVYGDFASSGGGGFDYKTSDSLPNPYDGGSLADWNGMLAFYAVWDTGATGTNTQINIGDVWKEIPAAQINIGDTWKAAASMQINIGDTWKSIF